MLKRTTHGCRRARWRTTAYALCAAVAPVLIALAFSGRAPLAGAQAPGGVGPEGGAGEPGAPAPGQQSLAPSFAVGLRTVRLLDRSRTIKLEGGKSEPRPLVTYIRYPAVGPPGGPELPNAPADLDAGPYPLVVFGHGFGVTPAIYARLLDTWARAGFVVAAPLFPLGNADTPGGPEESDVVNQPRDMSFVISSLLAMSAAPTGPMARMVNAGEIAVAGHSDGAETALAVAFSRRFRDPRVRAALVFSGAEMSGVGGYSFPEKSIPLLAVQGTADIDNEPKYTYEYFARAGRPKFLLRLLGAPHLPPYTDEQPQLAIVERTSLAFLERYLKDEPAALVRLIASASVAKRAALTDDP